MRKISQNTPKFSAEISYEKKGGGDNIFSEIRKFSCVTTLAGSLVIMPVPSVEVSLNYSFHLEDFQHYSLPRFTENFDFQSGISRERPA